MANSIDHWVEDCRDVTQAGGRGGYVQRMEVIVKRKKKVREVGGGGGGGGRVDVNGEVKLFVKIQKKKKKNFFFFFLGGGGVWLRGGGGGVRWM